MLSFETNILNFNYWHSIFSISDIRKFIINFRILFKTHIVVFFLLDLKYFVFFNRIGAYISTNICNYTSNYHTTKIVIYAGNHTFINRAVNCAVYYINAAVNRAVNHVVNHVTFLFYIFSNIKTTLKWLD